RRPRRKPSTSTVVPSVSGFTGRRSISLRRLPSPHDPIDATRLGQRLAALASALDDMPAQALRFARWRAHRDRMRGQPPSPGRFRRIWPPGGRLSRFDPVARRLSRIREVDEVLAHAHAMALYALENPRRDTS
ncbi:MAG TPA: hypothetical protein VIU14_05315, partial [Mesorhizobium sp.]